MIPRSILDYLAAAAEAQNQAVEQTQTLVNDPPKRGTHDTSDTKKGPVLEVATSDSGTQRSFYFPETCNWRWRSIASDRFLEVMGENNFVIAQIRADTVLSITNGQFLFRDSSWR